MPSDPTGQGQFQQDVFRYSWRPDWSDAMKLQFAQRLQRSTLHPGIQLPFPIAPNDQLRAPRQLIGFVGGGNNTTGDYGGGSGSSSGSDSGSLGSSSSDGGGGSGSSSSDSSSSSSSSSDSSSGSSSGSSASSGGDGEGSSDSGDSGSSVSLQCINRCPANFDEYSGIVWDPAGDPDCAGVCPDIDSNGNPFCTVAKVGNYDGSLCNSNDQGIIPCCDENPPVGCFNVCACCYFTGNIELAVSAGCNCP